ncbi:unnamed protein product [Brachionus calyciflorus]|uniref:Uncharacterized protein n=1 Tax=Brachionus calyciflorus TaxID=104777 RepID=A0A813ZTK0_9BILA|nr:unnamed protein product [Brachionus calyciflorus]
MGKNLSKLPYFRNFNIEQRVEKHLEKTQKTINLSPRHPSTQHIFKQIEESAPNVDEKLENKLLVEKSKNVKIYTGERVEILNNKDKRPKKENEILMAERFKNIDFEKYGYSKPDKIRHGFLTLRQFDEAVNKYMVTKSIDEFKDLIENNDLNKNDIHILIEYYKPFYKISRNNTKTTDEKSYLTSIGESSSA